MASGKINPMTSTSTFETFVGIMNRGKISFTELAKELNIKPQTLSNRLTALRKKGFIKETRNSDKLRERYYEIQETEIFSVFADIVLKDFPFAKTKEDVLFTAFFGTMIATGLFKDTLFFAEKTAQQITNFEEFFNFAKIVYAIQENPHPSINLVEET